MNIHSVWDNKGKTIDRYTVVFKNKCHGEMILLSLSHDPYSPQGVSQWGSTDFPPKEFKRFGTRIDFSDLPKQVQGHVLMRLECKE